MTMSLQTKSKDCDILLQSCADKMVTPMLSYYASYLQLRVVLSWEFGSAVGHVGELKQSLGARVLGSPGPQFLGSPGTRVHCL